MFCFWLWIYNMRMSQREDGEEFSLGLITLWIVFEISIVSVKEFFLVVEPLISHSIYVNYWATNCILARENWKLGKHPEDSTNPLWSWQGWVRNMRWWAIPISECNYWNSQRNESVDFVFPSPLRGIFRLRSVYEIHSLYKDHPDNTTWQSWKMYAFHNCLLILL